METFRPSAAGDARKGAFCTSGACNDWELCLLELEHDCPTMSHEAQTSKARARQAFCAPTAACAASIERAMEQARQTPCSDHGHDGNGNGDGDDDGGWCGPLCTNFTENCGEKWDFTAKSECAAGPSEPPCDPASADYDAAACKAGIEQYAMCVPQTDSCLRCVGCFAVSSGFVLDGQCKDDDARVEHESQGLVTSCALGAASGYCENQNLPAETPPYWFKTRCCATCSGEATTMPVDDGHGDHHGGSDSGTDHGSNNDNTDNNDNNGNDEGTPWQCDGTDPDIFNENGTVTDPAWCVETQNTGGTCAMSLEPTLLGAIRSSCDSMFVAGSGCPNICGTHSHMSGIVPAFSPHSTATCGDWSAFWTDVSPSHFNLDCPALSAYAGSWCCEGYCKDHDDTLARVSEGAIADCATAKASGLCDDVNIANFCCASCGDSGTHHGGNNDNTDNNDHNDNNDNNDHDHDHDHDSGSSSSYTFSSGDGAAGTGTGASPNDYNNEYDASTTVPPNGYDNTGSDHDHDATGRPANDYNYDNDSTDTDTDYTI